VGGVVVVAPSPRPSRFFAVGSSEVAFAFSVALDFVAGAFFAASAFAIESATAVAFAIESLIAAESTTGVGAGCSTGAGVGGGIGTGSSAFFWQETLSTATPIPKRNVFVRNENFMESNLEINDKIE
jgi:hypothetical protein